MNSMGSQRYMINFCYIRSYFKMIFQSDFVKHRDKCYCLLAIF